jgi:hypothetical protein
MFIVALSLVEFERKSHRKPIFIYIIYIIIVFYLFNPSVSGFIIAFSYLKFYYSEEEE